MRIQPIFLWTDILVYLLFIAIIVTILWTKRQKHWREPWSRVGQRKLGMMALVFLIIYSLVALLDSIHFRVIQTQPQGEKVFYSRNVQSLLDVMIRPLGTQNETTYSAPFAMHSSVKNTIAVGGILKTIYPRLEFGGSYLTSPSQRVTDIFSKTGLAFSIGLISNLILTFTGVYLFARNTFPVACKRILLGETKIVWREIILTGWVIVFGICFIEIISPYYHIFGTNKIGEDILYKTIKSIRTGLIIGTLTTLVMLPFAVLLGTQAGYFGGWWDDIIQYIYTTLSSVPAVLLISASVLSLEIFITNHSELFPTLESRADARLLALCIILGITSWTSLCRLLRAETLKLREMDFVKASIAMGMTNIKIIWRHIIPNVLHIILITVVLDFSALVLAEAVLSYVGVGVDPTTPSWGNMINSARLDLAREPIVWWPLLAAFVFMFILVLSANLFADAVRDAFDPRLRNVS